MILEMCKQLIYFLKILLNQDYKRKVLCPFKVLIVKSFFSTHTFQQLNLFDEQGDQSKTTTGYNTALQKLFIMFYFAT